MITSVLMTAGLAVAQPPAQAPAPLVVPQPMITLRTKHGMRMTVEKREVGDLVSV